MSKRKSRAKSMAIEQSDFVFEDDSSDFDLQQIQNKPKDPATMQNSKASGSRISARGKREKKIYDPSDNVPVNKKKKEEGRLASVKKTPSKLVVKTPTKTVELPPVKVISTPQMVKRKLELDQKEIADFKEKLQKLQPIAPAKEPIKRLQPPKQIIVASEVVSSTPIPVLSVLKQRKSVSSERSAITSSTVPVRDTKIPDVSKWTTDNVVKYFIEQGFDRKDALMYKEHMIDGEALMILSRDDLKNLNFKVGVFVKMWNRILRFQSGKDDPTQSWK